MTGVVRLPTPVHASDLTFNSAVNLSNDPFGSQSPLLAAAGTNVYAVWLNNTSGNPDILFRASNNDGTSFGPVLNLSNTPNRFSSNPQIAAVGSNVYVVWEANVTAGNQDVFFRTSTNNGASFGTVINLSHDTKNCDPFRGCLPQIAASGTNVYVAWSNVVSGPSTPTDIFFVASTNNGGSFTATPVNLSNDKVSNQPAIAAAGSNVYVVWQDTNGGKNDLFFRASTDGGTSWNPALSTPPVNLSQNPTTPVTTSLENRILATGNNVYAVWTKDTKGTPVTDDVYFAVSTNNGASFGGPVNLSNNAKSGGPEVSAAGNNVYAIWEDHSTVGISLVSYRVSNNNGGSFASTISLSSSTGFALNPQIASNAANVYATWQDTTGTNDVFFRSSSDNGATFGATVNLSNNSGFSVSPAVAAGNTAFVAWQDDTPGNDDILFRAGTSAAPKITFTLAALLSGWNSTLPPGTMTACSPTGTPGCNPAITEFRGRAFTVQIVWKDSTQHDFAIYTSGFSAGSVSPTDSCSLANTNGCLAKSPEVTSTSQSSLLTFTPAIPLDGPPFNGPGTYEYYCQFHPSSMHGKITVIKSPDLTGDGKVDILDVALVAFSFGSTPSSSNWNIAADLDNNGKVDVVDVATDAFYFGQTLP